MALKAFRTMAILISFVLFISFLVSCQRKKSGPAHEEVTLVEVVPVSQGDISKEIRFTGNIEASTEVKVFPKITAKIEAVKVDSGDPVRRDDLIILLESEELRAQVGRGEIGGDCTGGRPGLQGQGQAQRFRKQP
jgi:multidrug efflux pump subunit AcrA (membrane-fusion protein)